MDLAQSFKKYLDIRQITYNYNAEDNTIIFIHNNWHLMFIYDKDDPTYFRLALPRLEVINNNFTYDMIIAAVNTAANYKVVKPAIIGNDLWFIFESFVPEYDTSNAKLFDRAINILERTGAEWRSYRNNMTLSDNP